MSDWLGTRRLAPGKSRSFRQARTFARSLGLKSSTAWFDYCRSGEKPTDIPYNPQFTYAEAGWAGYGDWLGTGRGAPGTFRSFKLARKYVHRLGLKSRTQWNEYCASGKKPADIPAAPQAIYAEAGWAGYGDWLKTGTVATHLRQYKSFKEARAYVHGLGLKSETQWRAYCKSGKKPDDIPAHADRTYADAGWAGMSDWLGTEFQFQPFKKARANVRRLGLKSSTEWNTYCKSGKKPRDIPASPQTTYADAGWAGMSDWLGTRRLAPGKSRSFKLARKYVHRLGLKSRTQWNEYCASGKKPADIPAAPQAIYAEAGWAGYGDWLGYVRSGR
jgi:hypothetical protein